MQALDKLVDNARGFCPPDGWVRLSLVADGEGARIALANAGPLLPEAMQSRLFDSLVSLRAKPQRSEGGTHLGFGLHIAKLITELHRGHADARRVDLRDLAQFVVHAQQVGRHRHGHAFGFGQTQQGALAGVDFDLGVLPGREHCLLQSRHGDKRFISERFGFADQLLEIVCISKDTVFQRFSPAAPALNWRQPGVPRRDKPCLPLLR